MGNVKIEFRRDIEVDLNAYYEAFSRGLRKSIEDELFKLLGGAAREAKSSAGSDGRKYIPINPNTRLCLHPQPSSRRRPVGSKTAVLLGHLQRIYQGGTFSASDFAKVMTDHQIEGRASTWLGNLARGGYVKVVP